MRNFYKNSRLKGVFIIKLFSSAFIVRNDATIFEKKDKKDSCIVRNIFGKEASIEHCSNDNGLEWNINKIPRICVIK